MNAKNLSRAYDSYHKNWFYTNRDNSCHQTRRGKEAKAFCKEELSHVRPLVRIQKLLVKYCFGLRPRPCFQKPCGFN